MPSLVDLIPVAYCGGLQQSLPHFAGDSGVCQLLQRVVVGEGAQPPPAGTMWGPLLRSGCRTGVELRDSWRLLKNIGLQACTYLDRELQGALSFSVEGMGDGGLDGSVRKSVTDQLQGLQKAVLEKFLKEYPDQTARPVLHCPQLDKVSSAWVPALPGPSTHPTSPLKCSVRCCAATCASQALLAEILLASLLGAGGRWWISGETRSSLWCFQGTISGSSMTTSR